MSIFHEESVRAGIDDAGDGGDKLVEKVSGRGGVKESVSSGCGRLLGAEEVRMRTNGRFLLAKGGLGS